MGKLSRVPSIFQRAVTSIFPRSITATSRAAGTFAKIRFPADSSWKDSGCPSSFAAAATVPLPRSIAAIAPAPQAT